MLSSFLAWFDSLSLAAILAVGVILILVEMFILKSALEKLKNNKWLWLNLWQVFGVLLPVVWLLRVPDSYMQVFPIVVMIIYFGIYKPTFFVKSR